MKSLHQIRMLRLHMPLDNAFDVCINSIALINKAVVVKEDRAHGAIDVTVGLGWKSFGEIILFKLNRLDNEYTEVEFSSRSIFRTTLFDFGKNLKNVELIEMFLEECAPVATVQMVNSLEPQ